MTGDDVITAFSTFLFTFRAHFFLRMATPPLKNAITLPYGSPKEDVSPDIPAITQDEIIASGCVPDSAKRKVPDEVKKVTDDVKKALEDSKDAKVPPKKRKPKKKAAPVATAAAEGARYYYDIQNLVVADSSALEKMGLGSILPPSAPPPSPSYAAPWPNAAAPWPTGAAVGRPTQPFKLENPSPAVTVKKVTHTGNEIAANAVFCPDCGLRVEKHGKSEIEEEKAGQYVITFVCPDD